MATKKGVRRPDYEIEISDSDGYIGRVCIANDKMDDAVAWSMLYGVIGNYIDAKFCVDDEFTDGEDYT